MLSAQAIASIIFALVYLIIILGESSPRKLDRPSAALVGAVLMVVCGVLTRSQALAAIDFPTLALLFGMMIVIHYAGDSGLLLSLARKLVEFGKTPLQLLWSVCISAGVLSALFVNDTICMLMTPILLAACRRTGLPAEPFLICLATSSNVGSAMTITGNPQNMLIGQSSHLSWAEFALRLLVPVSICLVLNGFIVQLIYRRELKQKLELAPVYSAAEPVLIPLNKKLALKTIVVIFGMLAGFLGGAPMDICALTAGVCILVWANQVPQKAFETIDWSLLLFFAGLFVVVSGFTRAQSELMGMILPSLVGHGEGLLSMAVFAGTTLVGSNIFGNVPYVMLIRDCIASAHDSRTLWLLLAATSTFAVNLTLVGSVANLIVANGARHECPLGFWTFMKVGVPSTIITTIIAVVFLYLNNPR